MKKTENFMTFSTLTKTYRLNIYILTLINTLVSVLALSFAYFSKDLIDNINMGSYDRFFRFAIILSLIMVLNVLSQALSSYLMSKYSQQVILKLKSDVFNHLMHSTYEHRQKYHSGKLRNILESDINLIGESVISLIPRATAQIIRFVGAFAILTMIDLFFSVIFFSLGLILFILSRLIAKAIKLRHQRLQESLDHERSFTQEALENIEVIQSFEGEDKIVDLQHSYQHDVLKQTISKHKFNILTTSGVTIFFAFGYAFTLIYGGYQLQFGLSIGYLVAMMQLIQHVQTPISSLTRLYPIYQSSKVSIKRVNELYLLPIETDQKNQFKSFDFIEAKNVSFSYDNHKVFNHLNFIIKPNDFILIKGPSGTGKSTLFKLLLGFIKPTSGYIKLNDEMQINEKSRSLFSYVPQDHLILSGSIKDNLNLFESHGDNKLDDALNKVSLTDEHIDINTLLQEKGKGLSIGQIQRLAIARALLRDAPILLLDEATSALDKETEILIINHLKTLKDKTIIFISHRDLPESLFTKIINI